MDSHTLKALVFMAALTFTTFTAGHVRPRFTIGLSATLLLIVLVP